MNKSENAKSNLWIQNLAGMKQNFNFRVIHFVFLLKRNFQRRWGIFTGVLASDTSIARARFFGESQQPDRAIYGDDAEILASDAEVLSFAAGGQVWNFATVAWSQT